MNQYTVKGAVGQYSNLSLETEVAMASPHRLVQMLLEGALEKLATGKGCLARGDIVQKNTQITWAISIINGLRMSLDKNAGGEIAQNLDDLYDYMARRLLEASREDSVDKLDEVISLLLEIKSAWDAIPEHLTGAESDKDQDASVSGSIAERA